MFTIDYDPRTNRLLVHVRDFWTSESVSQFAAAMGAKAQEIRATRSDYDAIIESLDFPVQSNDVADLLGALGRGALALTSGRAAIVVGSRLNRMQAERTHTDPRVRVFMTMADAEAWLAA